MMIINEIKLIKKEPTKENIAKLLEKSKKIYKNGDEKQQKKYGKNQENMIQNLFLVLQIIIVIKMMKKIMKNIY